MPVTGPTRAPAGLSTARGAPPTQVLLPHLAAAVLGDVIVTGVDGFDASVVWSAGDVAEGVVFAAHTFPQDGNGVEQFLADAAAAGGDGPTISPGHATHPAPSSARGVAHAGAGRPRSPMPIHSAAA